MSWGGDSSSLCLRIDLHMIESKFPQTQEKSSGNVKDQTIPKALFMFPPDRTNFITHRHQAESPEGYDLSSLIKLPIK